jgi:hypothetical protein
MGNFNSPNDAVMWALSYIHCSNVESIVFNITDEDKIEAVFKGSKKNADTFIDKNRGVFILISLDGIQKFKSFGPFWKGLCLN